MQQYVSTGDVITTDSSCLMGHGTTLRHDGALVSTVCGFVERVSRLISVRPLHSRYTPEVGDVVIGRIMEIGDHRWKVDIGGRAYATLQLSAITLPGNVLRRRTIEDALSMRTLFAEGEIIIAEIQKVRSDGGAQLHTRAGKYGKATLGVYLCIRPSLIRRCRSHFQLLECGVLMILGVNGMIWLTIPKDPSTTNENNIDTNEADNAVISTKLDVEMRERIARVRNSILLLSYHFHAIYSVSVMKIYTLSFSMGIPAKALLNPDASKVIIHQYEKDLEANQNAELHVNRNDEDVIMIE